MSAVSEPSTLAQWLSTAKEQYLLSVRSKTSDGWTVVMGNEAGDLDSIASSIAYSWIESNVHNRPSVPLIRFNSTDLKLRKENIHALTLSGLAPSAHELLFSDDLDQAHPFPSAQFALVDHNRLAPQFAHQNPAARVLAVIDHHTDEGLYKDTANPRVIAPAGSCASHVAGLCPPSLPAELATLLLSAISIDTNGVHPGGKALDVDYKAVGFLAPRSTFAALNAQHQPSDGGAVDGLGWMHELTTALNVMKADLSELNAYDLLRRDYKQSTYTLLSDSHTDVGLPPQIDAGLSSVPLRLSSWATGGRLAQSVASFMDERGLSVLGILTSFRDEEKVDQGGKGKHRREQLWIVRSSEKGVPVGKLSEKLWRGLEGSGELKLKRQDDLDTGIEEGEMVKVRVYKQKNADATRKVTAPVLRDILEGVVV